MNRFPRVSALTLLLATAASAQSIERVKKISTLPGAGLYEGAPLAGKLLFSSANDNDNQLWTSDGTAAGTVKLQSFQNLGLPDGLTVLGNAAFFSGADATHGKELWRTDGTAGGTAFLKDLNPSTDGAPSGFTTFNGALLFTVNGAEGGEVWRTDGSAPGTTKLAACALSGSRRSAVLGSTLLFACNAGQGSEVWKTDGTAAGTGLVKAIDPEDGAAAPQGFAVLGNTVYFAAHDGTHGTELWRTDGTEAGTSMVVDLFPGAEDSEIEDIVAFQGSLYFGAHDGPDSYALWKSDGTAAGTVRFRGNADAHFTVSGKLQVAGERLFIVGYDDNASAQDLWVTDGTHAGTLALTHTNDVKMEYVDKVTPFGDRVLFTIKKQLFSSDGTLAGTGAVASAIGAYTLEAGPWVIGERVYFGAAQGEDSAGTTLVAATLKGGAGPQPGTDGGTPAASDGGTSPGKPGPKGGCSSAPGAVSLLGLLLALGLLRRRG